MGMNMTIWKKEHVDLVPSMWSMLRCEREVGGPRFQIDYWKKKVRKFTRHVSGTRVNDDAGFLFLSVPFCSFHYAPEFKTCPFFYEFACRSLNPSICTSELWNFIVNSSQWEICAGKHYGRQAARPVK